MLSDDTAPLPCTPNTPHAFTTNPYRSEQREIAAKACRAGTLILAAVRRQSKLAATFASPQRTQLLPLCGRQGYASNRLVHNPAACTH